MDSFEMSVSYFFSLGEPMNIDMQQLRLIPEDTLHSIAMKVLKSYRAKLQKRLKTVEIIHNHNSIKGTQAHRIDWMQKQLGDLEETMAVLERDREVKSKRARLELV